MSDAPIGYAPVPLPSRGLFYGGKVPDGTVHIRKLKVGEEAAIQASSSGYDLINAVVSTAVKLPDGMHHLDLLVTDRVALLIALRAFTFGRQYGYTYRCRACGAQNRATADLGTDLKSNLAKDGVVEPILVNLPDAQKTVGVRFLRGRDEAYIAQQMKRAGAGGPADNAHILRISAMIATVDGAVLDSHEKERFVRDMTMLDSITIQDAVDDNDSGVDLTLHATCKSCEADNEVLLPFGADFFRPTRDKS